MKRTMILSLFLAASGFGGYASAGSTYAQTKYPIVLAHGFLGFSSIFGLDYFYGIASALQAQGATVYTADYSSVNSSLQTGEQLLAQVQKILAVSGAAKVNLIGHSQGGQTARYVAAVAPSQVASVTAVDGVIGGSAVADYLLSLEKQSPSFATPLITSLLGALGQFIDWGSSISSAPVDAQGSLNVLSTAGSTAFNTQYLADLSQALPNGLTPSATNCGQGNSWFVVNGNPIAFFSWTGDAVGTNLFDISDLLLDVTSIAFGSTINDGLVAKCQTHLGWVISDTYNMNHLDAVNQVAGLVGSTNPVQLYVSHANRLKSIGL